MRSKRSNLAFPALENVVLTEDWPRCFLTPGSPRKPRQNFFNRAPIAQFTELLPKVAPIRQSGMMTCDSCHRRIQPGLCNVPSGPKYASMVHGSNVDSVPPSLQHLLKAVSVLAEVMQQPGKIRQICKVFVM